METDVYYTIKAVTQCTLVEQRSRFIAYAYPVETEREVDEIIKELKRKYHDARHVCFAYRLGESGVTFRANDDGEPSGTAGRPILGQIDSFSLTNTLIAVVRYFGGIKLGTPGLINAYKTVANDVLCNTTVVQHFQCGYLKCVFEYELLNTLMRITKQVNATVDASEYEGTHCSLTLKIRSSKLDLLRQQLMKVYGIKIIE